MANLETIAKSVHSKDDFVVFLQALVETLRADSGEWKNKRLEDYLDAAGSWAADSEGYYKNLGLPIPKDVDWKAFADILMAARIYE